MTASTGWRHGAIVSIKLIHSAIFLVNSAAVLQVFVAGVGGRPSRWTRTALTLAFAEVAVFLGNRGRCPLTDMVEWLGAESGRVSDIFLPRWFADRIPQLCGPLLLVGVLALGWRSLRRATTPARGDVTGDTGRSGHSPSPDDAGAPENVVCPTLDAGRVVTTPA